MFSLIADLVACGHGIYYPGPATEVWGGNDSHLPFLKQVLRPYGGVYKTENTLRRS